MLFVFATNFAQADLLQDKFERGWQNAQNATRFAAMLRNKLHVFLPVLPM